LVKWFNGITVNGKLMLELWSLYGTCSMGLECYLPHDTGKRIPPQPS